MKNATESSKRVYFNKNRKESNPSILIDRIIDVFENVLYENNMYIPDEDREGSEEEACIYGRTYYKIEEMLKGLIAEYDASKENTKNDTCNKISD